MKEFLKTAAITAVIVIVLMLINVYGNMHGIDLDSFTNNLVIALCAIIIYRDLTRNKKN